jgi:hypothetical protein
MLIEKLMIITRVKQSGPTVAPETHGADVQKT